MNTRATSVLIVGASARSAAQSALRADLSPIGVDQFADTDLLACAKMIDVKSVDLGLLDSLRPYRQLPLLFSGGIENHPALLQALEREFSIIGASSSAISQIRNPDWLLQKLSPHGVAVPEVRLATDPPCQASTTLEADWIIKPIASAGGRGVSVWCWDSDPSAVQTAPHYFQKRIVGTPISALWIGINGELRLVGISHLLIGLENQPVPRFAWCGNIVGTGFPADVVKAIEHVGRVLQAQVPLAGFIGADFILQGNTPWLVEINPRYTGSVELFELLQQRALLKEILTANVDPLNQSRNGSSGRSTESDPAPNQIDSARNSSKANIRMLHRCLGKRIVYADRRVRFQPPRTLPTRPSLWELPQWSDIPATGQIIYPGDPVCSVFAADETQITCEQKLAERVREVREWLVPVN